jgi:hypothetical protein
VQALQEAEVFRMKHGDYGSKMATDGDGPEDNTM